MSAGIRGRGSAGTGTSQAAPLHSRWALPSSGSTHLPTSSRACRLPSPQGPAQAALPSKTPSFPLLTPASYSSQALNLASLPKGAACAQKMLSRGLFHRPYSLGASGTLTSCGCTSSLSRPISALTICSRVHRALRAALGESFCRFPGRTRGLVPVTEL